MASDRLFSKLTHPRIMTIGWHLAQGDSRDDFVRDPVGHADYAFSLSERLAYIIEEIQSNRYRPRYLQEVYIPKSGLSVRPGNVLPIEEASILHAAIYLIAPKIDKKLDSSVYSYRLHSDWENRARKKQSIFREVEVEVPFLKSSTISSINPFEAWYERWPKFEEDAKEAYQSKGYTHLTKTDIFSFFENIDLQLLENLLRSLLGTEEEKLLQLIFTILRGWNRVPNAGMPIHRGIPQGNDVSSFLGNIFLIHLDRALKRFCNKCNGKWFRYVDDVKVYTNSETEAREAVFEINNVLREMHLNLQGGKTEILTGDKLRDEHDNRKLDEVNEAFNKIRILSDKTGTNKQITAELKNITSHLSHFTVGLPDKVRGLKGKESRLFRRLLTTYSVAHRTRKGLKDAVYTAIRELPDLRILRSCLSYLYRLDIKHHSDCTEQLLSLLESGELLFPYQAAAVLEAMIQLHPANPERVSSRVRNYALGSNLNNKRDGLVIQKALELIAVFPYREEYVERISIRYSKHDNPMVKRASIMLLSRAPKSKVRKQLAMLSRHPDFGVSRLSQYLLQMATDREYSSKELRKFRTMSDSDNALIRRIYQLYAASATEDSEIAKAVYETSDILDKSKSVKIKWHKGQIRNRTKWHLNNSKDKAEQES